MATEKIKKELRCYLTEAETVGYAKQAAVLVERIEDQENEKKMTAKQYAAEISALQDELFGLSRKVRNGFEVRNVDCEIVSDFDSKQIVIVRTDTGEPIESRKMTSEELQRPLFEGKGEVVEQFPQGGIVDENWGEERLIDHGGDDETI